MAHQPRQAPPTADLYEAVAGDFYEQQKRSVNPLRRWFHTNRYRLVNSLVKARYAAGVTTVVDLGCGSCDWNTSRLPVIGVDVNEPLLATARERGCVAQCRLRDARDTGLADASADVVVATEFLEHLPDCSAVIREMRRILRPGGAAIVSVPYDTWLSMWRPLFACQVFLHGYLLGREYYRQRCGHVQHFSPAALSAAFTEHGFAVDLLFSMRRFSIFLVARVPGEPAARAVHAPDLTLILPCLNEARSIGRVLAELTATCPGARVIVADDGSRDGTQEVVRTFADRNVQLLDRSAASPHGLTASVLDALSRVSTDYLVVLDSDGQHPPTKATEFLNLLRLGAKVVVGSRVHVEEHWPWDRKVLSYLGTGLGKAGLLVRGKQFLSYDILTGFFGLQTAFFRELTAGGMTEPHFRRRGYKVLFDLLKRMPADQEIEEVYYRFETRQGGESKLSAGISLEYLRSVFR